MDTERIYRSDPSKTRVRDVRDGDTFKDGMGGDVTVRSHPSEPAAYWQFVWSDGGYEWNVDKPSTTLLRNLDYGRNLAGGLTITSLTLKRVDFNTVILSEDKKAQIHEAISQIDNQKKIFEDWGFNETFEKGTAVSLLFYGPPGTGKTLMAKAIADRYNRELVMVSTAEIETPEPGGAERNLKKYFEEAKVKNQVLLFDECDSLITDRGRVGMIMAAQINALLTELENYTGVVVFTTNRLGSLDPAFDRRLSLKLEFPMPTAEQRVAIWKRMFPAKAPLAADINWERLASIEIAGGHIKNVVLKAARKAATNGHHEITDAVLRECLIKEVESMTEFTAALDHHNPWYGRPMQGGVGGMGVTRDIVRSDKTKNRIER